MFTNNGSTRSYDDSCYILSNWTERIFVNWADFLCLSLQFVYLISRLSYLPKKTWMYQTSYKNLSINTDSDLLFIIKNFCVNLCKLIFEFHWLILTSGVHSYFRSHYFRTSIEKVLIYLWWDRNSKFWRTKIGNSVTIRFYIPIKS